jgi:hypothetical protein
MHRRLHQHAPPSDAKRHEAAGGAPVGAAQRVAERAGWRRSRVCSQHGLIWHSSRCGLLLLLLLLLVLLPRLLLCV